MYSAGLMLQGMVDLFHLKDYDRVRCDAIGSLAGLIPILLPLCMQQMVKPGTSETFVFICMTSHLHKTFIAMTT
jgi:hypothetical protein